MKKLALLVSSVLVFIACNKENNEVAGLQLTGNIKGLSQGKIYIQKIQDSTLVILDSIIFKGKNSNFESKIALDEPEMLYIFLDRGQTNSIDNNLPFFAEPVKMELKTTLKQFYADSKITGSKNHELLQKFNEMNQKFTMGNLTLIEKRLNNELNFNQKTADSIDAAYEKLLIKKYRFTANYAATHGEYEVAPFIALSEIADINVSYLEEVAKKLSPKVANSKYGKMLNKHIEERKANK
jgi:hypothetical protein